ncbi:MAG: hypothetical protein LBF75_08215 [Treponema sp.]|jgi:hypothetical protein|nr:hypothetical protein [Treponema sp.]
MSDEWEEALASIPEPEVDKTPLGTEWPEGDNLSIESGDIAEDNERGRYE